ncbi:glycine betaine ABC transporter substrate-binding protein [Alkalicoccus daliensis]|uniref:Glycine betaine/proline transport system substrate-binding protein n=1 Tax=Alkalicoccus daliensis TaxID=745820 RepID=A0A1H0HIR2_9BACI|nr:glycine betaine ABC transporter substrate-binding protein [Alkalicoccus daliensis]SDO18731.1 glycine betaine/proline transport system substrate-binding protein [Alkalicoccus daliensis]
MILKRKYLTGTIGMTSVLLLAACGNENNNAAEDNTGNNETEESSGESIGEQVNYEIVGIDPGTGIMDNAEIAIEEYGLDENWSVLSSSGPVMTSELGNAIEDEEPIIVTGWQPHWKFMEYDLKFLEDPELVFGEGNDIHTLVRNGLQEDLPGAYQVIDQFHWDMSDMEEVMVMAEEEDTEVEEAARQWIEENEELVAEWTEGAEEGDGQEVEFTLVNWADAVAATNVVSEVLKDLGYETNLVEVMIDAMYAGLATDGADAMFASWMPAQQQYYDDYEEDFEDLGPNTEGTRIGLVVPAYMDIDSIEDLREE